MGNRISIKIDYRHRSGLLNLLALALMVLTLLGYLAWGEARAAASSRRAPLAASAGMRQYYLTQATHNGAATLSACQEGYHMASLWELFDPSALRYNTQLGHTTADSGQGPPSDVTGWVRTGYSTDTSNTPGQGNCGTWFTSGMRSSGSHAYLPTNWDGGYDAYVWEVGTSACNETPRVWCVADNVGSQIIYLPMILRGYS